MHRCPGKYVKENPKYCLRFYSERSRLRVREDRRTEHFATYGRFLLFAKVYHFLSAEIVLRPAVYTRLITFLLHSAFSTMMFEIAFLCIWTTVCASNIDPSGYVVFCPCMGRFGNQVDQLLGVMQFTHYLDRTLVLPNFIEYPYPNTAMVPFENIFQVSEIRKYLKIVAMVEFTRDIMPKLWPAENRTALCWSPRKSFYDENAPVGCHPKEGNPFGPYWDKIGVSFANDAYFGDIPGGYDLTVKGSKSGWQRRFSALDFPVLAFPSPPAHFPSRPPTWELQRYLKWSSRITGKAIQFIKEELTRPYVGIHLRNDKDWDRVCEHVNSSPGQQFFASMQCDAQEHYDGTLSKEMCAPSATTIIEQVVDTVGKIGARSVFVASDRDHMIEAINEALLAYDVKAHRLNPDDPLVSLAILGKADHFIGNCVGVESRKGENTSKRESLEVETSNRSRKESSGDVREVKDNGRITNAV
ncbi:hypothetical protein RB195_019733 [Necator americanus]|uniref:GDP-fucose protein O-fucosyltransferase 1 n=1 Tax=Necator americanus TaxID=51031 RepID=A0ABR1CFL7_NECAM